MITINIDGSCEPNPSGHAGYGAYITQANTCVKEITGSLDKSPSNSNNVAEYRALIEALNWLIDNGFNDVNIEIRSDSKLLVNQMNGKWGINSGLYFDLAIRSKLIVNEFPKLKFTWIPREQNNIADKLSRLAINKLNGVAE